MIHQGERTYSLSIYYPQKDYLGGCIKNLGKFTPCVHQTLPVIQNAKTVEKKSGILDPKKQTFKIAEEEEEV